MGQLKGVIFGWDNVLVANGELEPQNSILEETKRLVKFLVANDVEIVVVTNKNYNIIDRKFKKQTPAKEFFEKAWGINIDWHLCGQNGGAGKQSHAGFTPILEKKGWKPNNTVFVGNSKTDMLSAVNNKVLLLTAKWYPDTDETTNYGFLFSEAKLVARFIDVFCLRGSYWYYQIIDKSIEFYALAPYGTLIQKTKDYSNDFLFNVKYEKNLDDDYWVMFLSTSLYFSGVYEAVDYITAYPKSEAGKYPQCLVKPIDTFAKSFNKKYILDLIERHTTAPKSHFNRNQATHFNQLNTIRLCQLPSRIEKGETKKYAKFPIGEGKTVLVIDDICTEGLSFEAARHYLNSLGIRVISVAFLKAVNRAYRPLNAATLPHGAFNKNAVTQIVPGKTYSYRDHIVDEKAVHELDERLKRFRSWDWPIGS
jgi:hypothetical protein